MIRWPNLDSLSILTCAMSIKQIPLKIIFPELRKNLPSETGAALVWLYGKVCAEHFFPLRRIRNSYRNLDRNGSL
jgi:hypothetical protein